MKISQRSSLFLKQVSLKTHFERIFDPISRNKKNLIAQLRREGMFHKKFHFSITRHFEQKPKKITVLLPYNKLKRVNLKTFFKNFKLEETEEIKVRWQDKLSRFPRKLLPPNLKSDDVNTEIEEFFNKTTNYICEISPFGLVSLTIEISLCQFHSGIRFFPNILQDVS